MKSLKIVEVREVVVTKSQGTVPPIFSHDLSVLHEYAENIPETVSFSLVTTGYEVVEYDNEGHNNE